MTDAETIEEFRHFLSWGVKPDREDERGPSPRHVPPGWFAYVLGLTPYCPPKGEL